MCFIRPSQTVRPSNTHMYIAQPILNGRTYTAQSILNDMKRISHNYMALLYSILSNCLRKYVVYFNHPAKLTDRRTILIYIGG